MTELSVAPAALAGREERKEAGRALRTSVAREDHGEWTPAIDRPDPVAILETQAAARLPDLVPLRHGRMLASPFGFFRGAAALMAMDLASTPVTGLTVQACGDAHISNFGEFATPERNVVFDLNDFEETRPGPWEWDVKRLAASVAVVCRQRGFSASAQRRVVAAPVAAYRQRLAAYSELRVLELWYTQISVEEMIAHFPPRYRPMVRRDVAKARTRTHLGAVAKLTVEAGGGRRFAEDPPLLVHFDRTGHEMEEVEGVVEGYRGSLAEDRRALFDRFRLVDVARHAPPTRPERRQRPWGLAAWAPDAGWDCSRDRITLRATLLSSSSKKRALRYSSLMLGGIPSARAGCGSSAVSG